MLHLKQLLCELADAEAIGHRQTAVDVAVKHLAPFSTLHRTEQYLLATVDKGAKHTLMLEAHIDEVGMIVTNIFEDGFLAVSPVGTLDGRFLPSTPVRIFGKEILTGVFAGLPPHLKKEDTCASFEDCYIDTGRADIGEKVSLGDFVLFDAPATPLLGSRITGKAMDNRCGVAAVIATGKRLATADCPFNLQLFFPLGEELGLRGAKVGSFAHPADQSISVDVSFGDCPDVPTHKTAKLGSGAMIGVSPVLSGAIYNALKQTAKQQNIPFTLEVMGGTTSTDADAIALTGGGIPSGLVSIPLRHMHTPVEVVDLADLQAVCDLLYHYAMKGEPV